jgi:hypothetical protein
MRAGATRRFLPQETLPKGVVSRSRERVLGRREPFVPSGGDAAPALQATRSSCFK